MTPSEVLMDVLSDDGIDEMQRVIVIFRRSDGTICDRVDGSQSAADSLGLMTFAKLSMEYDLQKSWDR
jgi:hypothetical protein